MATAKKTHVCEALVIGGDLAGLLIGEHLRQSGLNVRIFDPRPQLGKNMPLKADLEFFPNLPQIGSALEWMGQLLRHGFSMNTEEVGPVHFDEGHLRPFVGFGDRSFASRDEIDFYTATQHFTEGGAVASQAQALANQWQERGHIPREATKLIVEDGRISMAEFNGEELWVADKIICTLGVREILELLPLDAIEGRNRSRLGKTATWTSVSVHALHRTPITSEKGMHILFGHGQEFEPIVGRVWPIEESGQQHSVWTTLVGKEFTDESDHLSHALKHLKRQVKRVYPTAFENLADEKLIVAPESHGHLQLKTANTFSFPELPGFFIATPLLSPFRGTAAAVDVAARFAASLTENLATTKPVEQTAEM